LVLIENIWSIDRLNTANIGATAESDYTSIGNKDITILPSVTVLSETITISEDGILENDETFSVTVASRSSPHLITASPAVTIVTIEDNDGKDFGNALILQHVTVISIWI
jgi:hypothetical protein